MKHLLLRILSFSFLLGLMSCGGTVIPTNPIREMQDEFKDKFAYTIVLDNMELEGEQYRHQYKVFTLNENQKVNISTTDWKPVSDDFFALHADNFGMELLSKTPEGKYNNLVAPPGFTLLVGNEKLGNWTNQGAHGSLQTWAFNDDNLSLAKELRLDKVEVNRLEYLTFKENYLFNRPFYGEKVKKDSTKYGTRSTYWVHYYPLFYLNKRRTRDFYKPTYSGSYGNRGGGGFGK